MSKLSLQPLCVRWSNTFQYKSELFENWGGFGRCQLKSSDTSSWWLEWTNNHQCTSWGLGCSSHFGDEPKTHPPLPKVFGFFNLFSAPKLLPPTYLPPTYLPPPTSILPTSPLLPTSPHFALIPSSKLGRTWSERAELGARSGRAEVVTKSGRAKVATKSKRAEVAARTTHLK
jgi:hypothetical protein